MKMHKIVVFTVIAALVGFQESLLYAGSLVPGKGSSIISPRTALVYTTAKDTDKRLTPVSYTHLTLPTKRIV